METTLEQEKATLKQIIDKRECCKHLRITSEFEKKFPAECTNLVSYSNIKRSEKLIFNHCMSSCMNKCHNCVAYEEYPAVEQIISGSSEVSLGQWLKNRALDDLHDANEMLKEEIEDDTIQPENAAQDDLDSMYKTILEEGWCYNEHDKIKDFFGKHITESNLNIIICALKQTGLKAADNLSYIEPRTILKQELKELKEKQKFIDKIRSAVDNNSTYELDNMYNDILKEIVKLERKVRR